MHNTFNDLVEKRKQDLFDRYLCTPWARREIYNKIQNLDKKYKYLFKQLNEQKNIRKHNSLCDGDSRSSRSASDERDLLFGIRIL